MSAVKCKIRPFEQASRNHLQFLSARYVCWVCRSGSRTDIRACQTTILDVPLVSFTERRVGETMRTSRYAGISIAVLAILWVAGSTVVLAESADDCIDFAFRSSGGFNGFTILSGDLKLEGAIGVCDVSLAAWAEMKALPSITPTLGGELKLSKEWLSLSMSASQNESQMELSLKGQAAPSAWLLYEGVPTLIGGVATIAETGLLERAGRCEITLSPFLTGVIPVGKAVVSPSIGLDVRVDSENQALSVSGSRVTSTVNVGTVLIANTVQFTGTFDAFSSLVVSINVPDCGLTVFGSLIPNGSGGFVYRASASYEWGNASLLPVLTGKPGPTCTGDVCF